jgi:hypothetical protein
MSSPTPYVLATLYHVMGWKSRILFLILYTPSSKGMEGIIPPRTPYVDERVSRAGRFATGWIVRKFERVTEPRQVDLPGLMGVEAYS